MLKLENVNKTFNSKTINEKKALMGMNLHIEKGDFTTIIGSNGAGKSTLFNSISGTFLIDNGRILLDDKDITFTKSYKRSKYIGILFQDPMKGTAPRMTIEENLSLAFTRNIMKSPFSLGISKLNKQFFKEQLSRLDLGLEDRLDAKVGLLSGGQRQALSLLMATIVMPKLLLLDEHTAALDPATADKVISITKQIVKENNLTCMMITHNVHSALALGNRTIMMDSGSIILDIKDKERDEMTVPKLLSMFKSKSNKELDDDRILFSS